MVLRPECLGFNWGLISSYERRKGRTLARRQEQWWTRTVVGQDLWVLSFLSHWEIKDTIRMRVVAAL